MITQFLTVALVYLTIGVGIGIMGGMAAGIALYRFLEDIAKKDEQK